MTTNSHSWSVPMMRGRMGHLTRAPLAAGICLRMTRDRLTALAVAAVLVLAVLLCGLSEEFIGR